VEVLTTAIRLLEAGHRHAQSTLLALLDADDGCRLLHRVAEAMGGAGERVRSELDALRAAGAGSGVGSGGGGSGSGEGVNGLCALQPEAPEGGGGAQERADLPYFTLVLQLRLLQALCARQHAGLQVQYLLVFLVLLLTHD